MVPAVLAKSLCLAILWGLFAFTACSTSHKSEFYKPYAGKGDRHYTAEGKASWYGPGFHGRRTASGERYNMNALTAAHRSLPFGAQLKVTNLVNDREVIVKVNDRGPFIKGRIIDLSREAAQRLAFKKTGTVRVRIEWIQDTDQASQTVAQAETEADSISELIAGETAANPLEKPE